MTKADGDSNVALVGIGAALLVGAVSLMITKNGIVKQKRC